MKFIPTITLGIVFNTIMVYFCIGLALYISGNNPIYTMCFMPIVIDFITNFGDSEPPLYIFS